MIFSSNAMNLNIKDAVGYLTFKGLEQYKFMNHAVSTRLGGVSREEFKSMNLSFRCGDSRENVIENYKIFCSAAGFDYNSLVASNQSHTCNIRAVGKQDIGAGIYKPQNVFDIDALITNEPGVTLVTFHADCAPIFFMDPNEKVIALAHAGWRGTLNGIAGDVIKKMRDDYGCKSENVVCAIGPTIQSCCFEVGEDLYNKFKNIYAIKSEKITYKDLDGRYKIDILETNRQWLISEGVEERNIFMSDLCTKCSHDLLISHRAANGKRGVMAAMMCIK